MTIRILVNGAQGKMGHVTVKTIKQQDDMILVGETGRKDDLASAITETKPDVVIDLTSAEAVWKNAQIIVKQGVRPVIGSSGLLPDQIETLQAHCEAEHLGGIIVPNFSIGAVLMMQFAEDAAKYLPHVEIVEYHHTQKLDAPSGTAMKTAEMIAAAREEAPELPCKETIPGALGAKHQGVPIHSVRLPGTVAHQAVIFGDVGQTLTIRHDSIDRQAFMPGVLLSCRQVMHLESLVYGLEHIL